MVSTVPTLDDGGGGCGSLRALYAAGGVWGWLTARGRAQPLVSLRGAQRIEVVVLRRPC